MKGEITDFMPSDILKSIINRLGFEFGVHFEFPRRDYCLEVLQNNIAPRRPPYPSALTSPYTASRTLTILPTNFPKMRGM